jgi:hypothetical protein
LMRALRTKSAACALASSALSWCFTVDYTGNNIVFRQQ